MIKPLFPLVRFFSRSSNGLVPSSPSTATTLDPGMIVPMLDRMDGLTTIVGHDRWGFNVNGIFMRGSILVFKNYTMLWNVSRAVDVSPRALAPLHMLRPKPDFVLVGTGSDKAAHINPAVYAYLSRKGISLEVMSTAQAIHTFNLLMEEGRNVAAALVALEPMSRTDASLFTDEPLEKLVRPRDVVTSQALALDYLPQDRALLTDGPQEIKPPTSPLRAPQVANTATTSAEPVIGYGISGGVSPMDTQAIPPLIKSMEDGASPSRPTIRPASEGDILSQQVDRGKRRHGGWNGGEGNKS